MKEIYTEKGYWRVQAIGVKVYWSDSCKEMKGQEWPEVEAELPYNCLSSQLNPQGTLKLDRPFSD